MNNLYMIKTVPPSFHEEVDMNYKTADQARITGQPVDLKVLR